MLLSCIQNSLNVAEPLDPTAVKPMPFQDRVTFSMSGGKPAATAPSKPVDSAMTKPVTSNTKKGNAMKRPASSSGSQRSSQRKISQK